MRWGEVKSQRVTVIPGRVGMRLVAALLSFIWSAPPGRRRGAQWPYCSSAASAALPICCASAQAAWVACCAAV